MVTSGPLENELDRRLPALFERQRMRARKFLVLSIVLLGDFLLDPDRREPVFCCPDNEHGAMYFGILSV